MKLFVRLALVAACLPLVAGCTFVRNTVLGEKFEFRCPQPTAPGLAIAIGARANSPKPEVPPDVRKLITESMTGCGKVTVVRVDGRPTVARELAFSSAAKTKQNFQIDQNEFLKNVVAALTTAKAQAAEANVLQALSVAGGAVGAGGTVVLIDSGVQTTAPLDFRKNNLSSRRPTAVASALKKQGLLPNLTGRRVILSGLGYTASPQTSLDDKNRAFLVDLWSEIALASGAKNRSILEGPNTEPAAVTSPTVSTVAFPTAEINLGCDTLSVLPDNGDVGFIPDQADFRNPAGARTVLQRFADFLTDNPTAAVEVQGYIAHYSAGDLSQRRADRVKKELVSLGAGNKITPKGMGWGPYPNPSAPPDKRYDQLNRRVTISVTCD
jgi:OOP family OmpA-OmpF porin